MLQDVADACSDAMVSLCLPGPLSLGGSSAEVTAVYQQVVLAALQPHRHNPMTPKLKVGPAGARPRLFGGPCLAPAHGGLMHLKCSTGIVMAKCQLQTVQFVLAKQGAAANMLAIVLWLPQMGPCLPSHSLPLWFTCGCRRLGAAGKALVTCFFFGCLQAARQQKELLASCVKWGGAGVLLCVGLYALWATGCAEEGGSDPQKPDGNRDIASQIRHHIRSAGRGLVHMTQTVPHAIESHTRAVLTAFTREPAPSPASGSAWRGW